MKDILAFLGLLYLLNLLGWFVVRYVPEPWKSYIVDRDPPKGE